MKKFIIAAFVLLASLSLYAQDAKKNINVKAFRTEMTYMIPQRYGSESITSDYGITVKKGMVTVHLPYMGNITSPSFDNDGLNFTEPLKMDGKPEKDKEEGTVEFKFSTRHGSVSYDFKVTAYDNGVVEIMLTPSNGDMCSYRGDWYDLKGSED